VARSKKLIDAYSAADAQPEASLSTYVEGEKTALIAAVDGVSGRVGVKVALLARRVGLGEAAHLGVVIAGTHLVLLPPHLEVKPVPRKGLEVGRPVVTGLGVQQCLLDF
jgi:hypothetical protein